MRTGKEKITTIQISREVQFDELNPSDQGLINFAEFVRDELINAPEGIDRIEIIRDVWLTKLAELQTPKEDNDEADD